MKRRLTNIVCAVLFFTVFLVGCSEKTEDDRLKIVTTIFPQYDFACHITGDRASVSMLLTPGAESHSYEPTPSDISKIQSADLFIYNGGESEVWVDEILNSLGKDINTLRLMDHVDLIESEHDHEDHDEHNYDEHIFTSLKNADILMNIINEEICSIDGENSDFYSNNTRDYCEQISKLDKDFEEMTDSAKRKTVVFGDRFPFVYFARDYDLECYAAFSGCSSETEASTGTVSELISIIKKENIPIVFYIEFSSHKTAEKIGEAANTKTALLHSCHNISKEDMENNVSYLDLMRNNYNILLEALN